MKGMTDSQNRVSRGVPTGGQFAATNRPDSDVNLTADTPVRSGATNELSVPGPYELTGYTGGADIGREGPVWRAKLRRDGKVIAEVFQDGNGGSTWTRFTSRAEEEAFSEYAKKWTHKWGVGGQYNPEGFDHDEESILNQWGDDAYLARSLNRAAKNGLAVIFDGDQSAESYAKYNADNAEVRKAIAEKYPNARRWDVASKSWVPVVE